VLVAVFAQGGVLRNPNEGLCGQIPNIALRAIASLYIELVPLIWNREEKEARGPTLHRVYCVSSIVLMGRETGLPQLLAPLLLTGGKGADLVIRGNVVLNNGYRSYWRVQNFLTRERIAIQNSRSASACAARPPVRFLSVRHSGVSLSPCQ
jgi:hypothetical protein